VPQSIARRAVIVRRAGLLLIPWLCAACGDATGPASQALAPSHGAIIAIALPSVLKAGDSAQATASVTDSNGDGRFLTSGWRSDATAVASVFHRRRVDVGILDIGVER
jgi:hypothetical protein